MDTREKVFKVIGQVMNYPVEKINSDSSPDNIEAWDSMSAMNLVLALEEAFNLQFKDEHLMEMMNAGLIVEVINEIQANS